MFRLVPGGPPVAFGQPVGGVAGVFRPQPRAVAVTLDVGPLVVVLLRWAGVRAGLRKPATGAGITDVPARAAPTSPDGMFWYELCRS
jgi:hypothetical protein